VNLGILTPVLCAVELQLHVSIVHAQPCDLSCLVLVSKLLGIAMAYPQTTDGLRKVLDCLVPLFDQSVSVWAVHRNRLLCGEVSAEPRSP
jgi:hypothetical protein